VEMDNLAKAYWAEKVPDNPITNADLEGEYWPLCIQGHKVSGHTDTTIYEYIHGGNKFERWQICCCSTGHRDERLAKHGLSSP